MSEEKKRAWEDEGDVALEKTHRTDKPRQYKVVLHNDHYTTMEFVVMVLMRFFQKSETEAMHVMLTVHHKGSGVAGVYSKDVAETKVHEVTEFSQENGMPLRLTTEPT
ncbi:MAG: ATP-dependent Clp protease adaptor ClpS [Deltaproteobacteria bacterium]|nr:ATP-dependent Clp protease adaptor ClpS [Deltaproteobacteria bacterium]